MAIDAIDEGPEAPVFYTRHREAEIIKFIDNTFHAVKIASANEVGSVCSKLGVSRVGRSYGSRISSSRRTTCRLSSSA